MPIDIETFESDVDEGPTHAERIIGFLAANDDKAFERREVADETGIDVNAVSSVLSRLKERGLVRHKPPYWAIGNDDRIEAATAFSRDLNTLNERLGVEDMDDWRKASDERGDRGDGDEHDG